MLRIPKNKFILPNWVSLRTSLFKFSHLNFYSILQYTREYKAQHKLVCFYTKLCRQQLNNYFLQNIQSKLCQNLHVKYDTDGINLPVSCLELTLTCGELVNTKTILLRRTLTISAASARILRIVSSCLISRGTI